MSSLFNQIDEAVSSSLFFSVLLPFFLSLKPTGIRAANPQAIRGIPVLGNSAISAGTVCTTLGGLFVAAVVAGTPTVIIKRNRNSRTSCFILCILPYYEIFRNCEISPLRDDPPLQMQRRLSLRDELFYIYFIC